MNKFWFLFYNIFIVPSLYLGIRILGLFNNKTKRGINGRRRVFEEIILNAALLNKNKKLLWFHSSSLGEFEQAKPIIEELKKNNQFNILVSFFSPSGYENSKKYPYADIVSYIPFDTVSNARRFISIARPSLAIIMRYDIWPNHIWAMKEMDMNCFLVDATMKNDSPRKTFFIKNFHKHLFRDITRILTVSPNDASGFKEFGCSDSQVKSVGDTRFDRVYQRSLSAKRHNLLNEDSFKGKKIFVAGSTWDTDEDVLIPAFKTLAKYDKNVVLIIVPHEPTVVHLDKIEHEFANELETIRFSYLKNYKDERVIIVDSVGILLTLYTYADVAYIGGGFKQNIHNILEAAVYGIPVVFGPRIDNSQEAKHLLERGGGIIIRNKREAYRTIRELFSNDDLRKTKGDICSEYIEENLGATKKIIDEISRFI